MSSATFACKMQLKPRGKEILNSSCHTLKFHFCLSYYANTLSISHVVCRLSSPHCLPSLQLRITIRTSNPRVRLQSAGNFEDVTSFCEGFRSLGICDTVLSHPGREETSILSDWIPQNSLRLTLLEKLRFYSIVNSYFPFNMKPNIFCSPPSTTCYTIAARRCLKLESRTASCGGTYRLPVHIETVRSEWERVSATKWRNEGGEGDFAHFMWPNTCRFAEGNFLKQDVLMGSNVLALGWCLEFEQFDSVNNFTSCNFVWTGVRYLTK